MMNVCYPDAGILTNAQSVICPVSKKLVKKLQKHKIRSAVIGLPAPLRSFIILLTFTRWHSCVTYPPADRQMKYWCRGIAKQAT